jgi:hypothetical protein
VFQSIKIYGDFGYIKRCSGTRKMERKKRMGSVPKHRTMNRPCTRRNKLYKGEKSTPAVAAEGLQLPREGVLRFSLFAGSSPMISRAG